MKRKQCIWRKTEETLHDEALKLSYHKAEARCGVLTRGYERNVVESNKVNQIKFLKINKRVTPKISGVRPQTPR